MPAFPLDPLTTLVLVSVITSLCVWAWMRAARITDDQDEKEAERLWLQFREWNFPRRVDDR